MPILDPSLQLYLLCNFNDHKCNNNDFILRYMKIASLYYDKNLATTQASLKFKEDLCECTSIINELFGHNFIITSELESPSLTNSFSYFLEKINQDHLEKLSKNQDGYYYIYKDIYQIHFFQPSINFSKLRAWYFTDSPIAILCVNLNNFQKKDESIIPYINMEIDIMTASGFTLVLCFMSKINLSILEIFIQKTIETHQFAEIHFNYGIFETNKAMKQGIATNLNINSVDLFNFLEKYEKIFTSNGYFYLYTRFPEGNDNKNSFKKYKSETPYFELIFFSSDMTDVFKHGTMESSSDSSNIFFIYCKTGFDLNLIRILLCNVPLYNLSDVENDFIPYCSSGFSFAYINKKDFLNCEDFRVHILFDDITNNRNFIEKYVDFDDIHLIRPDFYVKDALYLTRTDINTLNKIREIQINADKKYDKNQSEDIKKERIFHFAKTKQIKKGLEYVIYAYQHYANKAKLLNDFHVHTNQIFAAFEACKICLLNENEGEKGVIYQVETGEGKSCIIQLIAAVLALSKKTVHITSSNINLANRDYYDSFTFFQQLHLESAVLLHYNELPYINFQNLPNDDTEYKKEFYPRKFFKKSLFDNPSNMNFSVCGFSNQNELTNKKANIVFSTFINFESLYLKIMEIYPSSVHNYFNECTLLIDEADSILIDELTNGTILSRPMNTNGKEILAFVFKCHQEKMNTKQVLNEVKQIWPECTDISENDIIEMYNEIDIVHMQDFINGKKYSIEKVIVEEKKNYKRKAEDIIIAIKNLNIDGAKEILKSAKKEDFIEESHVELNKELKPNEIENEISESDTDLSTEKLSNEEQKKKDKNLTLKDKHKSIGIDILRENNESLEFKKEAQEKRKSMDSAKLKDSHKLFKKHKSSENFKTSDNDSCDKKKTSKEKKHNRKSVGNEKKVKFIVNNDYEYLKTMNNKKDVITKEYSLIIPFDYEHKGVLEPNKEFSGFIQQFIAIKEMFNDKKNENMLIKDISMNYLYVSHPIFVNLYGSVCGFSGTVGNKFDKKIFKDHYKLSTMKIPRNGPNHRINLPIILCSDIRERNFIIMEEVIEFHQKGNPVLVIFQELNEIYDVYHNLHLKGIKNINIFDGKNEKIKPDRISGLKGAVSLGTNVCGRGTDIKEPFKPLHVIVTYYTSNTRVIQQAFGRTARQGNEGTVRIICLMSQYNSPQEILNENSTEDVLGDFLLKNNMQVKFIEDIRLKRRWIFDSDMRSQKISREHIKKMRETRININRLKACNVKFPICMNIRTFLTIQAQKIFSLYNCPNCKYTWMLFQRYLREMILETWSLFITQSDHEYYSKDQNISYSEFLNNKLIGVKDFLQMMLPPSDAQCDVVSTYMHIFDFVKNFYQDQIMSYFPKRLSNCYSSVANDRFCSLFIGFRPFSLINKSGSRINSLDGEDYEKEYISDPELKYIKKQPQGSSILMSITERIDDLFDCICKLINNAIGGFMGLKFFIRRTLGGCEFGLCFDFELENVREKTTYEHNCIIDRDPLLVFSINVKSIVPLLAGILIIFLVYVAKIAAKISEIISSFGIDLIREIIKTKLKDYIEKLIFEKCQQTQIFCDKIYGFITKIIIDQIGILRTYNNDLALVFGLLLTIATSGDFSKCDQVINKLFDGVSFIKMNSNIKQSNSPKTIMFKVGFLLILAFGSFMMNFQYGRNKLKYNTEKVAEDYNKNQKTNEAFAENEKYVNDENIE